MVDKNANITKTCGKVYIFFFAWFLECLSSTILISVTVAFAQQEFGAVGVQRGLIISIMACTHLIGNIVVGRISDKCDRRLVISGVFLSNAFFACLFGFSRDLLMLVVLRGFAGLLGTTPPLAYSLVTSLAPDIRLVAAIGTIHSVAFVVGPLLALALQKSLHISDHSSYFARRSFFFLASCLSLTSALFVFFGTKKNPLSPTPVTTTVDSLDSPPLPTPVTTTVHSPPPPPVAAATPKPLKVLKGLWQSGLGWLWLARLSASWAQVTVTSTLSPLASEISPDDALFVITVCNAVGGATCALAQSLGYTFLEPKLGTYRVMEFSLVLMGISFVFYFLVFRGLTVAVYIGHGLLWVGAGLFDISMPTINRQKLELTNSSYFGLLNGVVMSFRSVSQILCPLIANVLIADHKPLLYASGFAACVFALGFALAAHRKKHLPIVF